jgi:hypothetical protein
MALIPNESYSFPDDEVIRPKKTKQSRAQLPQVKLARRPGSVVAKKKLPPLPPLPAPLALARRRALQDTAVKSVAPRVQQREGENRARETVPVNRPVERRNLTEKPRPTYAPAVSSVEELQIDLFDPDPELQSKPNRRSPWIRFVILELIALAILILSGWLTLARVHPAPSMVVLLNILTISAAAAVAIIPIIFFAIAPALSRR